METKATSGLWKLDWRDVLKGLLVAALTQPFMILQQSLAAGKLTCDWRAMGMAAVGGLVAYLVKNFFTPEQVIVKPDTPAANATMPQNQ